MEQTTKFWVLPTRKVSPDMFQLVVVAVVPKESGYSHYIRKCKGYSVRVTNFVRCAWCHVDVEIELALVGHYESDGRSIDEITRGGFWA